MSGRGSAAPRRPTAFVLVVLLVAILGFYFVLLGVRGLSLFGDSRLAVKGLGLGVLLLPLVGVVIVAKELQFGRASQRLAGFLDDESDGQPVRVPQDREDADAAFEERKAEVEAAPTDWRGWYRLGVAYGDAGDIGRGRRAVRRAIALEARSAPDRRSAGRR